METEYLIKELEDAIYMINSNKVAESKLILESIISMLDVRNKDINRIYGMIKEGALNGKHQHAIVSANPFGKEKDCHAIGYALLEENNIAAIKDKLCGMGLQASIDGTDIKILYRAGDVIY